MFQRVFGRDASQIDIALVQSLVETEAEETHYLDFKSELPSKQDQGHVRLAEVVSAFANADGGVVVFGINDNDGDRAVARTPVPLPEVIPRITHIVNSLVRPPIPALQWKQVPDDAEGLGYVFMGINPSVLRPHLVFYKDERIGGFRRSGRDRYPLTEGDIERAYRERTQWQDEVEKNAQRIEGLATQQLPFGGLWSSVVPISARRKAWTSPSIGENALRATVGRLRGLHPAGELNTRHRFRRIEIASNWNPQGVAVGRWSALFDHGEFLRVVPAISTEKLGSSDHEAIRRQASWFLSSSAILDIVLYTLSSYRVLAEAFKLSGDLLIRVGILPRAGIGYLEQSPGDLFWSVLREDAISELQVAIDDLFAPAKLLATAQILSSELYSAFGVDKSRLVSEAGHLTPVQFNPDVVSLLRDWAQASGVAST